MSHFPYYLLGVYFSVLDIPEDLASSTGVWTNFQIQIALYWIQLVA